jgi:hypothetical protein
MVGTLSSFVVINPAAKGAVETNMVWVENEQPFKETGVTMAKIADEAGKHGIAMWAGKAHFSRLHCTCMSVRNFTVYGLCDTGYRESFKVNVMCVGSEWGFLTADTKGAVGGSARLVLHHQVPKPEVIRFVNIVRATLAAAKKM